MSENIETSAGEANAVCSTLCDPNCDAVCHEDHAAGHKKRHWPYDCPAADEYFWDGDQFTADAIKRLRRERDAATERAVKAEAGLKAVMQYTREIGEVQAGLPNWAAAVARAGYWQALQRVSARGAREQRERAEAAEKELAELRERIGKAREEWGQKYSGGGYLTRVDSDWMRERWPVEQWAWDNTRHGGVVGKRTIIIVEDWREIRSGDLPEERPDGEQKGGDHA